MSSNGGNEAENNAPQTLVPGFLSEVRLPSSSVPCAWKNQSEALRDFASFAGPTQSQGHIKPLHWYVACRLVVEGGFNPQDVTPRPPLTVRKRGSAFHLEFDPVVATGSEQTILGGMKTKNVDVVVTKPGLGPVLAVSCKGMTAALRNLTNRMEETIGECTNLHITYPALVFGYLFVIRGNRAVVEKASEAAAGPVRAQTRNDIAIDDDDNPVASLVRFHYAMSQMGRREGVRDDVSRYESVALAGASESGELLTGFPPAESSIRLDTFFTTLYRRYEERFVFNAAKLRTVTDRLTWSRESPLFKDERVSRPDYGVRWIGGG